MLIQPIQHVNPTLENIESNTFLSGLRVTTLRVLDSTYKICRVYRRIKVMANDRRVRSHRILCPRTLIPGDIMPTLLKLKSSVNSLRHQWLFFKSSHSRMSKELYIHSWVIRGVVWRDKPRWYEKYAQECPIRANAEEEERSYHSVWTFYEFIFLSTIPVDHPPISLNIPCAGRPHLPS
jgi:hypothetical protein